MASDAAMRALAEKLAKVKNPDLTFEVKANASSPQSEMRVAAIKNRKLLGYMDLGFEGKDKAGREIKMVNVDSKARRQGIATQLYAKAQEAGLRPLHSKRMSPEGASFAKSIGGAYANMGLGAANILGFLPMLMQGGQIMTGKDTSMGPQDPTIGMMR